MIIGVPILFFFSLQAEFEMCFISVIYKLYKFILQCSDLLQEVSDHLPSSFSFQKGKTNKQKGRN